MFIFWAVAGISLGSLSLTGGFAWYVRSNYYRSACAARLSAALGLPSDIGVLVPRSRRARQFNDITVWLPERRGRALVCENAIVRRTPTEQDPSAYEIELTGGACEISERTWLRKDYRGIIESGLRPGFSADGPRRVIFRQMDLAFASDGFRAELLDARGQIEFENAERGTATVVCRKFNGYETREPVRLTAAFSPRERGVRVDQMRLSVPDIPLEQARLEELGGIGACAGRFRGELLYSEHDAGRSLIVSGKCVELELAEFTSLMLPQPLGGRAPDITLHTLRMENGRPAEIVFGGRIEDAALGDILANLGYPGANGSATLDVGRAELDARGIRRFVASGKCTGVSLALLSDALGWGKMTGTLVVRIDDLTIVDNRLKSLDATLRVLDATENPNWVEGALLREVVRRALKITLPPFLPERIEYTKLGLRLEVRDEQLFVFGTHGERSRTILTVRLLGEDFPMIHQPRRSFDLQPVLDSVRAGLRSQWNERNPFDEAD